MAETTEQYRTRMNQIKTSVEQEPAIRKMRDDIAEGLGKTGNRQADIENQFQSVIDETTGKDIISAPEILAARNGEANLNARLLKKEQEFEIEMAMNMLNDEQLRAYVDLLQQQITNMGSISPAPYDTLAQLEAARPNGDNSIYVVVEDGYWYYWNAISGKWTPGDVYQESGIGSKTVTNSKLSDTYSNGIALDGTANFNTLKRAGVFLYSGSPLNCPPNLSSGIIKNDVIADRWLRQTVTKIGSDSISSKYERIYDTTAGTGGTWKLMSNPNNYKFPYLTSANDLNNIIEEGKWVGVSPKNAPYSEDWNIKVERYYTTADSAMFWGTQTATTSKTSGSLAVYQRSFFKTASALTFNEWVRIDASPAPLTGGIIVGLTDSIWANTQGSDSVPAHVANRTGAIVHNTGFGGSRIAKHDKYWDAFSLYRIVDELVKPNTDTTKWQLQDEAISASENGLVNGMPWYFASHLALLKTIDFSKVTHIVIHNGTNDLPFSMLDNSENKYDLNSMGGALRYSIEKLISNFKQLKILISSPIYRFWMDDNGVFIDDSNTRVYNGNTLIDFVEKQREIAKEYTTAFSDNYFELGFNKFNKGLYYPSNDGTHPNAIGNKRLGNKTGIDLINSY